MGIVDHYINNYLYDKRRFADLINALLYGGRQVLDPVKLRAVSTVTYDDEDSSSNKAPKKTETRNDIAMRYEGGDIYRIFLEENQNNICYSLPVRNLDYLAKGYNKQHRKLRKKHESDNDYSSAAERLSRMRREDRFIPIHILWLYHGEEKWDGPRRFRDILQLNDDDPEDENESYGPDPKLICLNEFEDYDRFKSDLRELAILLNQRSDLKKLQESFLNDERLRHVNNETLETASVLMSNKWLWEQRKRFENEDEEDTYDMCTAFRQMREEIFRESAEEKEALRKEAAEARKKSEEYKKKEAKAKKEEAKYKELYNKLLEKYAMETGERFDPEAE